MTFLAPYALAGLALLALPILVHLFKPRKMRQTPFSSLRWLKQTRQRLSRRIQWHQWLLFLVRAGVIVLLVLALARPLLDLGDADRPVDRFVIVDLGQGMAYHEPDRVAPLARAQELAAELVQQGRPGDRTALILAGARPRLVTAPVVDAGAYLPVVKAARAGAAEARLSATLPLIRALLPREEGREAELVFLTDNRAPTWQQADVQAFVKDLLCPVRVQVADVGPGAAARNGWIADARLLPADRTEGRVLRVEAGCVGDGPQERRLRLAGIAGMGDESQAVTLHPGQVARLDFKIAPAVRLAGQVAEVRLEPPDALPGDDRFFVNLDASAALRVLLIEPETPARDGRSTGLYLRAGLDALSGSGRSALEVTGRTAVAVAAADVAKADVILLAGVPELTGAAVESLEKRVRSGGGLVVFLGDAVKTDFYNQRLFNPLQPAAGLLPAPLKMGENGWTRAGQAGLLTGVRWDHPLLVPLHDPVFGDLARSRFPRHAVFATPGEKDTVLARFDNDVPALLEHPLGAGRVLVFNTSANDDWSDLPRRNGFVPLLDRLLTYLSGGGVRHSFLAGEAVTLPLPDVTPGAEVVVTTPGGDKLVPRLWNAGGQTLLHLEEVAEAGTYRVTQPGQKETVFVVNVSRGQSRLTPMDPAVLRSWWTPVALEALSVESASQRSAAAAGYWVLWPALVFLAGVLLLLETLYVAVLCPRVNPTMADSVVHGRGILRPLKEQPAQSV